MDKTTEGSTQVFTVNTTTPPELEPISIVAGDGITVAHANNTYTISATISGITYDFSPDWFIVTNNTVTINEAKLDEVAQGIAASYGSQINTTATAIIDTTFDDVPKNIVATITTTGDTASANVRSVNA